MSFRTIVVWGLGSILLSVSVGVRAETPAQPAAPPAPIKLLCPASVQSAEQIQGESDWTGLPGSKKERKFREMSVYDGHPSAMASLVPDDAHAPPKSSTWNLDTPSHNNEGYWVGCAYKGTTAQLMRKLPDGIKKCTNFFAGAATGLNCK